VLHVRPCPLRLPHHHSICTLYSPHSYRGGRIQKFPDWPTGARTANVTVLCQWVQLYRYFVSQSSEFFRHNSLCCFSLSVYFCLFRYRLSPETFGYTLVCPVHFILLDLNVLMTWNEVYKL